MMPCARWTSALRVLPTISWFWLAISAVTYPTTIEFDNVFPRNDTYSPVDLMPIVFAVQNSSVASSLGFVVTWVLAIADDNDQYISQDSGRIDFAFADYSNNDPYFAVDYTNLRKIEGIYRITWSLDADYCHANSSHASVNNVTFTIKKGAKQPDLVATTLPNTCQTIQSVPFTKSEAGACPVLGGAPNPCALNITQERASSISAAITESACMPENPMDTGDCPQSNGGSLITHLSLDGSLTRMGQLLVCIAFLSYILGC
ncbi:hypothetical protein F5Y07DRAFT_368339 [Xylaria sp. FL0933]|nr:hypothetical protein F5Y07DRAFT_368339 [Xylaria sp. FL0933]